MLVDLQRDWAIYELGDTLDVMEAPSVGPLFHQNPLTAVPDTGYQQDEYISRLLIVDRQTKECWIARHGDIEQLDARALGEVWEESISASARALKQQDLSHASVSANRFDHQLDHIFDTEINLLEQIEAMVLPLTNIWKARIRENKANLAKFEDQIHSDLRRLDYSWVLTMYKYSVLVGEALTVTLDWLADQITEAFRTEAIWSVIDLLGDQAARFNKSAFYCYGAVATEFKEDYKSGFHMNTIRETSLMLMGYASRCLEYANALTAKDQQRLASEMQPLSPESLTEASELFNKSIKWHDMLNDVIKETSELGFPEGDNKAITENIQLLLKLSNASHETVSLKVNLPVAKQLDIPD